jgi:hypothetical protein
MILYQVTLQVDAPFTDAVEHHMRSEHIPEIFATGCFRRIHLGIPPGRLRTTYEAETPAQLDQYLQQHAPRFRADFQRHFAAGVTISREVWTRLESWG